VPGLAHEVHGKLVEELGMAALPPAQRFLACKYFVRETSPQLSEEAERIEAEVSFLCSLAGASLLSLILAVAESFTGVPSGQWIEAGKPIRFIFCSYWPGVLWLWYRSASRITPKSGTTLPAPHPAITRAGTRSCRMPGRNARARAPPVPPARPCTRCPDGPA